MSSRAFSTRGRGRGSSANNSERNSYDNRERSGSQPSPGTHQPRGRGRGSSANNGERNSHNRDRSGSQPSPGTYQTRGRGRGSSAERGSHANSGNRGGFENQAQRGNYSGNRRGQSGDRGQQSENSKLVDYSLISNQNVQWKYDTSEIGLVKHEFVKRKGHLTEKCGRKIKLMTNHFLFNFVSDVCIYHYNFVWTSQDKDGEKSKAKKLCRDDCYVLFDEVRKKYSNLFRNSSVGYDGNANVYLPFNIGNELVEVPVSVKLNGQLHNFKVTLSLVKQINLSVLSQYYNGDNDVKRESLLEAIQALHIILKFPSRNSMIALGRLAMFPADGVRYSLSDWIELALGHRKSIRFSEIGLTLVVDRAAAAFLKSDDPTNFIQYIFNLNSPKEFQIRPDRLSLLRRTFANVKICTDHLGYSKKYDVKGITDKPASDDTFKSNENGVDREFTVAKYFSVKYKELRYPNLPCILTSNGGKIPIEMCKIVQNQSLQSIKRNLTAMEQKEMINQTATAPDERFTCLLQAHKQIHEQINEALPDFKINIDAKPIGVDGIVLNSPSLLYQGKILGSQDTHLGAWNLMDKIFYKTKTFERFGVLDLCGLGKAEEEFREKFIQKAVEMRMLVKSDPKMTRLITISNYDNRDRGSEKNRNLEANIESALTRMKNEKCAFALCIFPEDKWVYNLTKRLADTSIHFPTQGISRRNVLAGSFQTIANILAKINKKLGGVNVILKRDEKPPLLRKKIMIIGADVTHPGEADELHSSVAASVSTYDMDHTMFYPSIRVQAKKDDTKATVEIIKEFKSMVAEHLTNFERANNFLPDVILYLRDGVSEGQYSKILKEEVKHLLNPRGNYTPKVTAVIISKRILTRTKPVDPKEGVGKFKNVPPGTTIDSIITHPSDFDYFQYGHKGIKGTSRPCHYYLIHDDNNLTTDEMAKISYHLCFIFERATSSTSAPAPVMHAHNLAFKARQWIAGDKNRYDHRGLRGKERQDAEVNVAADLNSKYSRINHEFAASSMFYV